MKTYRGTRCGGDVTVTVDGKPLPVCHELRNHSPSGFEWGYSGAGPSQLALAILADYRGPKFAIAWYQVFQWHTVKGLPKQSWQLTAEQLDRILAEFTASVPTSRAEVWEPIDGVL
jgi:hypothetical protein